MTTNNEKAVLFIGANRPIIGREKEAMSFWLETGAWLDGQKQLGWCTRWDAFWLTAHGGDLNSAFVCYGDRAKLDEWRRTDGFEAWVFRATSCLEGVGVIPGVNFAAAKETIDRRVKAVGW
ncbi:MAG TPA: hypothetical protein VL326_28620 [Kofleriaceae bacterium]|jgi:hypothetical protein|nr:hypothetical protein [Kofleriaceae bacterium]